MLQDLFSLNREMQQAARDITPPLPSLQSTCTSSIMESTSSKTSEKVRTQVLQNTKLLQLLLEKVEVPDESSALEQLPVEVHFPTSNREELDKLEDQLDNADVLNRVVHVKELGSIGGENMKTTVRRVLSHMIGKELATKINWVGKGDKIPFKKPKTTQRFDRPNPKYDDSDTESSDSDSEMRPRSPKKKRIKLRKHCQHPPPPSHPSITSQGQ